MIISTQFITLLTIVLTAIDWISKIILLCVIVLAFKKVKTPKQLEVNKLFYEIAFNTAALILLFSFTGGWPHNQFTIISLAFGASIGLITAIPIRVFKWDNSIYSQGTSWHVVLWGISLLILELLESWNFGFEKQIYLVALCNLAMLYGASFHLLLAYQDQD